MIPEAIAAKILSESAEGIQWERETPASPVGWRNTAPLQGFGDQLQKLIGEAFEVTEDPKADQIRIVRVFRHETVKERKRRPGELF